MIQSTYTLNNILVQQNKHPIQSIPSGEYTTNPSIYKVVEIVITNTHVTYIWNFPRKISQIIRFKLLQRCFIQMTKTTMNRRIIE